MQTPANSTNPNTQNMAKNPARPTQIPIPPYQFQPQYQQQQQQHTPSRAGTPTVATAWNPAQAQAHRPTAPGTVQPVSNLTYTQGTPMYATTQQAQQMHPYHQQQQQQQQQQAHALQLQQAQQPAKRRLKDIVDRMEDDVTLEGEVEEFLLQAADEWIDSVAEFACRLARHRGSDKLEVKDMQLHLERNYGMRIPGFGLPAEQGIASAVPKPAGNTAAGGKRGKQPVKNLDSAGSLRAARVAAVREKKASGAGPGV